MSELKHLDEAQLAEVERNCRLLIRRYQRQIERLHNEINGQRTRLAWAHKYLEDKRNGQ